MRLLAVLPILTAALAAACTLWPAAHRVIWPVVALAALNVILTPLTSGEWFYQRQEDASYDRAVAGGDFAAFDRQLVRHDPSLQPRMTAIAVGLLVALVVLAMLRVRARGGAPTPASTRAVTMGAVLLAAAAAAVQGVALLVWM